MPTFTVTVKNDETGETKTVTVNTDTMETAIVPAVLSTVEPEKASEEASTAPEPNVEPKPEVAPESNNMGLTGLFNNKKSKGGKRSTPSFRLKKRRITRKLNKAR